MGDGQLRVIAGEGASVIETSDPVRFPAGCVAVFVASYTARGFAESTIANDVGVLERMLAALRRPVWEGDRRGGGGPQGRRDRGDVRSAAGRIASVQPPCGAPPDNAHQSHSRAECTTDHGVSRAHPSSRSATRALAVVEHRPREMHSHEAFTDADNRSRFARHPAG